MSMIRCDDCENIFDSDADPDCFVEIGNMRRLHKTIVLCQFCRDRREMESERMAFEDYTADQQVGEQT